MADHVDLDKSSQRTAAGEEAGNQYTTDLEDIRDTLDNPDNSGTELGTMVEAQLKMTESETRYQVRAGIPKKVSSSVKGAADDVKRASG